MLRMCSGCVGRDVFKDEFRLCRNGSVGRVVLKDVFGLCRKGSVKNVFRLCRKC